MSYNTYFVFFFCISFAKAFFFRWVMISQGHHLHVTFSYTISFFLIARYVHLDIPSHFLKWLMWRRQIVPASILFPISFAAMICVWRIVIKSYNIYPMLWLWYLLAFLILHLDGPQRWFKHQDIFTYTKTTETNYRNFW